MRKKKEEREFTFVNFDPFEKKQVGQGIVLISNKPMVRVTFGQHRSGLPCQDYKNTSSIRAKCKRTVNEVEHALFSAKPSKEQEEFIKRLLKESKK